MKDKLTLKQKAFINAYLGDFNATNAAQEAGYSGDRATLASIGSENLRKPKIREVIDQFLAGRTMQVDEILQRLSKQARGSLDDFISTDDQGFLKLDLEKAKAQGSLDLVERVVINDILAANGSRRQQVSLKLYSAQKALELLGKGYGVFRSLVSDVDREEGTAREAGEYRLALGRAFERFLDETYGGYRAFQIYWEAVVCGFIPNPAVSGFVAGLQPSNALEGFQDLEEHCHLSWETFAWMDSRFGIDRDEIYNQALELGFIEGPSPAHKDALEAGDQSDNLEAQTASVIISPSDNRAESPPLTLEEEDEERFVNGVYRW